MKKIIAIVVLFLCFGTAVSASSINGDYNGFPIVKLTTGGLGLTEIKTEVPAFIYEGNTMVPIAALKELGASVQWNADTYTVRVSIPKQAKNPNIDMLFFTELLNKNSVSYVEYLAQAPNFTRLSVYYTGSFLDEKYTTKDFKDILLIGTITDAQVIQIEDKQKNIMWAYSIYAKDYALEKITYEEFKTNLHISVPTASTQPSTVPSAPSKATKPDPLLLYSNDGKTYLGKLTTDKTDADSIFNTYGTYGSKYQSNSIWNTYGDYGSKYASTSAFNDYATEPPIIILNGKVIGYLTTNNYTTGAISPIGIESYLSKLGY